MVLVSHQLLLAHLVFLAYTCEPSKAVLQPWGAFIFISLYTTNHKERWESYCLCVFNVVTMV